MTKQTYEQQQQQLTAEFQERYQVEQKKEWDALVFNADIPLPYRRFALAFTTPTALSVHSEYFKWLMTTPEIPEFNVSDVVVFCRASERTFMQYIMLHGSKPETLNEYGKYLDFVESVTKQVNEIVEPIRDKVFRKMKAMQDLQIKNGNRKIALA